MLHVELEPEVERRLMEAAHAVGLEPGAYASSLIAAMIAARLREKHLSQEELETVLARLASRGDNLPKLPDEAYTRASFYQDHD